MNLVHLIGEIHTSPELHLLPNGRRQVKFTLTTHESYLDIQGAKKNPQKLAYTIGLGEMGSGSK